MLKRRKKRRKDIDHETVGFSENVANPLVDQGVEYDRADAIAFRCFIDLLYHCPRFFGRIDVRPGQLGEVDGFELCQQALAECLGRDAGTVVDDRSSSFHCPWSLKSRRVSAIV